MKSPENTHWEWEEKYGGKGTLKALTIKVIQYKMGLNTQLGR